MMAGAGNNSSARGGSRGGGSRGSSSSDSGEQITETEDQTPGWSTRLNAPARPLAVAKWSKEQVQRWWAKMQEEITTRGGDPPACPQSIDGKALARFTAKRFARGDVGEFMFDNLQRWKAASQKPKGRHKSTRP
jgi:hypothetical protein